MSNNVAKRTKLVESTNRYSMEVTKEEFNNCNFPYSIKSPIFTMDINGEESEWLNVLYPKGKEDKSMVYISLNLKSKNKVYKARFNCDIETENGYWPGPEYDDEEVNYFGHDTEGGGDEDEVNKGWGYGFCTIDDFEKHFVEDKITIVTTLTVYEESNKYRNGVETRNPFMDNMRSISYHQNLTDFTIISDNERFPCHRVLLAVRSEYFEALFRNEPTKTEIEVDESPELVKTVLEYMAKGRIPEDIDNKAMDLILMADMYGLDILTMACVTSLIRNLSPDNAVETLIVMDKVKHVSKQEHRQKVLAYIKKEGEQIVKSKDWNKFVQNYPDLITEVFLLKCSKKHGTCFSQPN